MLRNKEKSIENQEAINKRVPLAGDGTVIDFQSRFHVTMKKKMTSTTKVFFFFDMCSTSLPFFFVNCGQSLVFRIFSTKRWFSLFVFFPKQQRKKERLLQCPDFLILLLHFLRNYIRGTGTAALRGQGL